MYLYEYQLILTTFKKYYHFSQILIEHWSLSPQNGHFLTYVPLSPPSTQADYFQLSGCTGGSDSSDTEGVGEVPVMSLKMRLFKGKKRDQLCSMFDSNHRSKSIKIDLSSDSESDTENIGVSQTSDT